MKKILSAFVMLAFSFVLVGCGTDATARADVERDDWLQRRGIIDAGARRAGLERRPLHLQGDDRADQLHRCSHSCAVAGGSSSSSASVSR